MSNETGDRVIDDYFGVCPQCRRHDGFINVGRSHYFFCKEHRVKWCVGANLFSSWRDETEAEQRRIYDEIGLGEFEKIEPLGVPSEPELIQELAHQIIKLTQSVEKHEHVIAALMCAMTFRLSQVWPDSRESFVQKLKTDVPNWISMSLADANDESPF